MTKPEIRMTNQKNTRDAFCDSFAIGNSVFGIHSGIRISALFRHSNFVIQISSVS